MGRLVRRWAVQVMGMVLVQRVGRRPVVDAASVPGYGAVFNAGVVFHAGGYHLFARGVRAGYRRNDGPGARFLNYVSDVLVFTSVDGRHYTFGYVLAAAEAAGCLEDPRVQWIGPPGRRVLVLTGTHLPEAGSGLPWRIGARRLAWDGNRFHVEPGSARLLGPDGVQDKDGVLFDLTDGRVGLIHRIHPDMQLAVFEDLDQLWDPPGGYWEAHLADLAAHVLIGAGPGALAVGAGAPPVPTAAGLLLFFHERRPDGAYTMNLALLDAGTGRLRSRLPEPVLVPEREWERRGDVDDVVFVQGAHRDGDRLYLTYGAADRCVGAATASVDDLLAALRSAA